MRVKRSEIVDVSIWALVGFYVLIAHWIWFGRGIQETILLVLFTIQVFRREHKIGIHRDNTIWWVLVIILSYVLVVTVNSHAKPYLIQDLKSISMALMSLLYLYTFHKSNNVRCQKYINTSCEILSVYMWINSIIILIQYRVPYFLMNTTAITTVGNSAYFDQLTGFIGINGTTRWNVLSCIVIIYYIMNSKNRREWVRTLSFVILSAFICMLNSARSFLIMMPMYVAFYYVLVKKKSIKTMLKYFGIVIALMFAIALVYGTNDFVKGFVDDLFFDKVAIYSSRNLAYMVGANDDRAVAINYALQHGGTFGNGIGTIPMHYANSLVKYLGLNSISSFIYMIGVCGYILYTTFLGILGGSFFKKKGILLISGFAFLWLVISFLLPVYSSIVLMMGTGIIIIMYTTEENSSIKNKRRY